jgi:hypothetical protein
LVEEPIALPMPTKHAAEWMIFYVCPPGQPQEPAGILLIDSVSDRLRVRMKTELNTENEDIALVWSGLAEDLTARAEKAGANDLITWLETTASHTFQLSERFPVDGANLSNVLDRLYLENVAASGSH